MTVFWNVAACFLVEVYGRFGSSYCIVRLTSVVGRRYTTTRLYGAKYQKIEDDVHTPP